MKRMRCTSAVKNRLAFVLKRKFRSRKPFFQLRLGAARAPTPAAFRVPRRARPGPVPRCLFFSCPPARSRGLSRFPPAGAVISGAVTDPHLPRTAPAPAEPLPGPGRAGPLCARRGGGRGLAGRGRGLARRGSGFLLAALRRSLPTCEDMMSAPHYPNYADLIAGPSQWGRPALPTC